MPTGFRGLSEADSESLLDKLMADACQPPRTYLHGWTVGDLVVWDNRCLMHRARPYNTNYPRALRASRISGEPESELAPHVRRSPGFGVLSVVVQRVIGCSRLANAATTTLRTFILGGCRY